MFIPKFISQFLSRKENPYIEKQNIKNKVLKDILGYVQSRTYVDEVSMTSNNSSFKEIKIKEGFYDSVFDSEKIKSKELYDLSSRFNGVHTPELHFERTLTHAYMDLKSAESVGLTSLHQVGEGRYKVKHEKKLDYKTAFRNPDLTKERVSLAAQLYKEVSDLKPEAPDFYSQLNEVLSEKKDKNADLNKKYNKEHRTGVRFFGKGTLFQSQFDKILSSAMNRLPKSGQKDFETSPEQNRSKHS